MTFYPLNSSDTSSIQDCKVNAFTDLPYSMQDIISSHLEKLRELEISGTDTLFSVTKHLLPTEEDSSTTRIMKAFLSPVTAITMGFTAVVDHTFKYVKTDCIKELIRELEDYNKTSKELLKLESAALKYFYSEDYEKFKKKAELDFLDIDNQHNKAEHTISALRNNFYDKFKKARSVLAYSLEKISVSLEKFTEIFSETDNPDISSLENFIQNLEGKLYFKSNIDIQSDCDSIKFRLSKIARKMDSTVQEAFSYKAEIFEKKLAQYIEKLTQVEKEISDLKRHQACKEAVKECVEFQTGNIKVTTSKTTQSEKQSEYDVCMKQLIRKKNNFQSSIESTISDYIGFFKNTQKLFKQKYKGVIIQRSYNQLKKLLQEAQIYLNQYSTNFPRLEKYKLQEKLNEINFSSNITNLILQCNFKNKYQEELEKYRTSIASNRDLIEKTEKKLDELHSLSIHSSLKRNCEQNLIGNKISLTSKNLELQDRYSNLDAFKSELSKIQERFRKLQLHIEETPEERKFNRLSMQFDTHSEKLKAYTPINISNISSEIDNFETSSQHWYL